MFFKEILYGTQYYRAPTPLPEEWDKDMANIERIGLDTVQIRIQWRFNEPREGEYKFDDIDGLFATAKKHNLKVIFKFLLETAPQYVYDKYDGYRVAADNTIIRSSSHGAFYVGGWLPCFTNPDVNAAAMRFVETMVKRYKDEPNLILWHVWNEPRNRPVGECYCKHCRKAYGKWLKKEYGTIDRFNEIFGTGEESFDNPQLPGMAHGFWDAYLFKKYKSGEAIRAVLRGCYESIKKYDTTRPIMAHAGFNASMQFELGDLSNDEIVSKAVDFYGTSLPAPDCFRTHEDRQVTQLMLDYLYAVDNNFFCHEIYPSLGCFEYYDDTPTLEYKIWSALAAGAKGICFWQYRAERLGNEQDCSGIAKMNGEPREICDGVKRVSDVLKKYNELFLHASPEQGGVGIVFDFDSLLLSLIEDYSQNLYEFKTNEKEIGYYHHSHQGGYRLFGDAGYNVGYVLASKPQEFKKFKALYFPNYSMADTALEKPLYEYVKEGGIVFADEGFALRDRKNTWLNIDKMPFTSLADVFVERRVKTSIEPQKILLNGEKIDVSPYAARVTLGGGKAIAAFENGLPAIVEYSIGKGKFVYFAAPMGYSYYQNKESAWVDFVSEYLQNNGELCKKEYSDERKGVYHRTLRGDGYTLEIIRNWSGEEKEITLGEYKEILTAQTPNGNSVALATGDTLCFMR